MDGPDREPDRRVARAVNDRAAELIATLELEPHPEGGYYRQLFKSDRRVQPDDDRESRSALTAIYFLLAEGQKSAWHRVQSDEIWIHLEGAPLTLHIGSETRVLDATSRIAVVPAGAWQSAELAGEYALVSCVVGPGFEFEDFELR
jgi:predicted cupin superfamily sugar epimerase